MTEIDQRVSAAWAACGDWLVIDDGSLTDVVLLDCSRVMCVHMFMGMRELQGELRFDTTDGPRPEAGPLMRLCSGLEDTIRFLQLRTEALGFELLLTFEIDGRKGHPLDITVSWRPREVFPEGVEGIRRFSGLMGWVLDRAELLRAKGVRLAPENFEDPRTSDVWFVV